MNYTVTDFSPSFQYKNITHDPTLDSLNKSMLFHNLT